MRIPILYKYVVREVLAPVTVCIFVFTGILFLGRSLKLIDLVVSKNVPLSDIILLFSYIVPRFLELAIPMSLLLGTILAFGRLSADSELVVIRAVGLSLKKLSVPVMGLAFAAMIVSLALTCWIRPWANYQLGVGMFEIAKMRASSGLSEGVFNDLGQLTIYAEKVNSKTGQLEKVLIADRRDVELNRSFIAKHAQVVSDDTNRTLQLELYDGSMQEGTGLNLTVTYFEINNISLPLSEIIEEGESRGKRSGELSLVELRKRTADLRSRESSLTKRETRRLRKYEAEFHQKFVIPTSCLFVTIIAMALGIQPSRGGQAWGATVNVIIGIGVIICYYLFFALGKALATQGVLPAWLALWTPNIIFAGGAFYLYQRMGSEKWLAVTQGLGAFLVGIGKKLSDQKETHAKEEGSSK